MTVQDKIRILRESEQWTQDEMAEKLGMSKAGYGKIERGENRISLDKLEKIAQIFDVDIVELIKQDKEVVCVFGEHNATGTNINYYNSADQLVIENEKLKLQLEHQTQLQAQQTEHIKELKSIIATLERSLERLGK